MFMYMYSTSTMYLVMLTAIPVCVCLGTSTPFYLVEEGYDSQLARSGVLQSLPALEPERGRLTFEWSAKKKVRRFHLSLTYFVCSSPAEG